MAQVITKGATAGKTCQVRDLARHDGGYGYNFGYEGFRREVLRDLILKRAVDLATAQTGATENL